MVRERRKMAEGDNNSVYQLVRAGGAERGLAAARACWGRRRSQARPALPCFVLPAAVAGEGRLAPRCVTRFGSGVRCGAARGAAAAAAGPGRGSGDCAAARGPEPPLTLGVT